VLQLFSSAGFGIIHIIPLCDGFIKPQQRANPMAHIEENLTEPDERRVFDKGRLELVSLGAVIWTRHISAGLEVVYISQASGEHQAEAPTSNTISVTSCRDG
jgi:hypothetical protein